jgi:hypothetical protein
VVDEDAGDQDLRHASAERVDLFQFGISLFEHAQLDVAMRGAQMLAFCHI